MGRPPQATASEKPAAVIPTEGLTPEEAVNLNLKDNLPVRATMGDIPEHSNEWGREESPRRERGGRERRERRGHSDRGSRHRHGPDVPSHHESVEEPAEVAPAAEAPAAVPSDAEAPATPAASERPRRLRFEDATPEASQRSVQEFRPSQRRARTDPEATERAAERPADKPRTPGLLGWMKSIFGGPETPAEAEPETPPEAPRRTRSSRGPRTRGPRQDTPDGPRSSGLPASGGDGGGGKRRRRRRQRGGRSHQASGERGSSGGAPG